jgi:hypothetical protein
MDFLRMRFLTPPPRDDDLNAAATSSSARYYSLASIRIILRRNTPALTASERLSLLLHASRNYYPV